MTIYTYQAFVIALLLLCAGFIWGTFYVDAPYEIFAGAVVAVFGGYGYKRLKQKEEKYQNNKDADSTQEESIGHE